MTRVLKENLASNEFLPVLPVKETPRRSKGIIHKERKLMFPGYILVQTEIDADLITDKLKFELQTNIAVKKYFYSILHYGENKKDVVVRERERLHLERLFNPDFCVTGSVGFIEGGMIRVSSGALIGMESRIKRINRHKREAIVEMEIMGAMSDVRLMLEVVEKAK